MMSGQWKGSQVFCDFSHNINALAGTLQILALPASSSSKYTQNQIQRQLHKCKYKNTKTYTQIKRHTITQLHIDALAGTLRRLALPVCSSTKYTKSNTNTKIQRQINKYEDIQLHEY